MGMASRVRGGDQPPPPYGCGRLNRFTWPPTAATGYRAPRKLLSHGAYSAPPAIPASVSGFGCPLPPRCLQAVPLPAATGYRAPPGLLRHGPCVGPPAIAGSRSGSGSPLLPRSLQATAYRAPRGLLRHGPCGGPPAIAGSRSGFGIPLLPRSLQAVPPQYQAAAMGHRTPSGLLGYAACGTPPATTGSLSCFGWPLPARSLWTVPTQYQAAPMGYHTPSWLQRLQAACGAPPDISATASSSASPAPCRRELSVPVPVSTSSSPTGLGKRVEKKRFARCKTSQIPAASDADASDVDPAPVSKEALVPVHPCRPTESLKVNVNFLGHNIQMPVTTESTVLQLVLSALGKEGIEFTDFYLRHKSRMLDGDLPVDLIPDLEASIDVCPRIRGGRDEDFHDTYESLDIFVNENSPLLFRKLFVEKNLDPSPQCISIWSDLTQYIIYQILIIVCREGHQRGVCWNGLFSLSDFMMMSGKVRMSALVPPAVPYTPAGGKADYAQLYKIVLVFIDLGVGRPSLHVMNFLKVLYEADNARRQNPDFITYIINHPSLLSFAERNRLYCLVDQLFKKLSPAEQKLVSGKVEAALASLVGHSDWTTAVCSVPELKHTYWYDAKITPGGPISRYGTETVEGFHLCRNFLSHPPQLVPLELAEIFLSYLLDYMLPVVIETLVVEYKGSAPIGWYSELMRVISNVRADWSITTRVDG